MVLLLSLLSISTLLFLFSRILYLFFSAPRMNSCSLKMPTKNMQWMISFELLICDFYLLRAFSFRHVAYTSITLISCLC